MSNLFCDPSVRSRMPALTTSAGAVGTATMTTNLRYSIWTVVATAAALTLRSLTALAQALRHPSDPRSASPTVVRDSSVSSCSLRVRLSC